MAVFQSRTYTVAILKGTDGYAYAGPPASGSESTMFDQMLADVLAELSAATTVGGVAPGATGAVLGSNGTSWVRRADEEGTFTATIVPATSGTVTLTSGAGGDLCHYAKVGNRVFVSGVLAVASVSSPVGSIRLSGLPFTVNASTAAGVGMSAWYNGFAAGATTAPQMRLREGTTTAAIERFAAGSAADVDTTIQAGVSIRFAGFYTI
jgi:hypothetical protein